MSAFEVPRADLVAALATRAEGEPLALTGPPGVGKTWMLGALRRYFHDAGAIPVSIDLFGAASSPDRFVISVLGALPAGPLAQALPAATRLRVVAGSGRQHGADAVSALFDLLAGLRDGSGRRVLFLFDEATEIRSLAYFKGLRDVHRPFLEALQRRGSGVVLATSFPTLARRLWPSLPVFALPPLLEDELRRALPEARAAWAAPLHYLTAGSPRYLRILWPRIASGEPPESAWAAEMAPGGLLDQACRQTFETLLLRSRGYGMAKAVLAAVAHEEGLNLTALVPRLGRTPGATRDYLQWLVDVDALRREGKRYFFTDPVLRAWARGLAHPGAPHMPESQSPRPSATPNSPDVAPAPSTESPATPPPVRRRDPLMEID